MRPVVFFDLDETLVSTTVGGTRVRPGVVDVLEALGKEADLFVFSAASPASIENRLRSTRLDRFFFGTFSTRATTDFRFVRGRPWVLVDDTNAEEKLERIDPTAVPEHHLVKVVAFTGQASSLKRYLPTIRERLCFRTNTRDRRGRFIPEKYLAGLPADLRRARVRELGESRDAYRRGAFLSLKTDVEARERGLVKKSAYSEVAERRGIEWQGDAADMAERVCDHYGVACSPAVERAIEQAFRRGAGAYYSGGHRPGATARNWSVARVASLVVGGKTTVTADADLYRSFPAPLRAAIEAKTDEVVRALVKQGREKDAAFVRR